MTATELELDYQAWERRHGGFAFYRTETRRRRRKVRLECGHTIDGSELYRYEVWKVRGEAGVGQHRACQPCARGL